MTTFEWRANSAQSDNFRLPVDTGEGCLFTCCSSQSTLNPALTLVQPVEKTPDHYSTSVLPSPGDDTSPPNSVQVSKMNGVAIPVSTSAGWSTSPPQMTGIYPSCVAYDLRVKSNNTNGSGAIDDSLELSVALEYTNPHAERGESMMVKVAIAKTLVNQELRTELALVATRFQEFVNERNEWVDITADVDYTQTANAVVDAVLQDADAGQTAGKATITAKTVDLTLGPFSAKARLHLTFQADKLYSYEAMSMRPDAADIGTHRLLPIWVDLPFAPVNHEAGLSNLAVRLQAPKGASILSVDENRDAYWDLKCQDDIKPATILAVSDLTTIEEDMVGYQFQWESLPPRSTGLLAWLKLPNHMEQSIFDFVHIGRSLADIGDNPNNADSTAQARVSLLVPSASDAPNLQVPLPGHGPAGELYRVKVKVPEAQPRREPCHIMNLTLSDKSGSTGIHVGGSSMRQKFNYLAESRLLKRLESIPALVKANVLRMDDIFSEVFLAFDHSAPEGTIRRCVFRVADVHDSITGVVQAIRSGEIYSGKSLPNIVQQVYAIRGVSPGGTTDFSVGPKILMQKFIQWKREADAMSAKELTSCAFVEFDTDGGHNGSGNYIQCLKNFCKVFDVRDGVVTGFGKWLNQDCASKVARVLGNVPAMLALQVPEPGSEGLDKVFRAGFSAWVNFLRRPPNMTMKVSAGNVSFPAPVSHRSANAVEVLGFRRVGERYEKLPQFGPPDISNDKFTGCVLTGVPSGDELVFYLISRLGSPGDLAKALMIQCFTDDSTLPQIQGRVSEENEPVEGSFLAFEWLRMLTGQSGTAGFELAPIMATPISSRLEDEVSFRFNIASPSGKTSYLGRCKTVADRAPIDLAHQPESPLPPLKLEEPKPRIQGSPHWRPVKPYPSPFGQSSPYNPIKFETQSAPFSSSLHSHEVTRSIGGAGGFGGSVSNSVAFSQPIMAVASAMPDASARILHRRQNFPQKNNEAPVARRQPLWKDTVKIPFGSAAPLYTQNYDGLLSAMDDIMHAKQRLQGNQSVNYVCDICNYQFSPGESRYHCFDCEDFDACDRCKEKHTLPFHRVFISDTSTTHQAPEDPLIDSLLRPMSGNAANRTVSNVQLQRPQFDRTTEWCKLRVHRFLLCVLHWWPVFRSTCAFRERLPRELGKEMGQRILKGFNDDSLADLLATLTAIIDSLKREHGGMQQEEQRKQPIPFYNVL